LGTTLVKGGVQLAVAEPGEAVATHPARGHLDWRAAGMAGERRIAGETLCATDLDQETSGDQITRRAEDARKFMRRCSKGAREPSA